MSKKKSHPKPLLSVIVPAYNHELFVEEAIRSILEQSLQDLEVLVIDDGSTDRTLEQVSKLEDPRIKVMTQKNKGTAKALNRGIKMAQGTYLAILNSDDLYLEQRLELMVQRLREERAILAFSQVKLIDGHGQEVTSGPVRKWLDRAYAFYQESQDLLLALVRDNFVCSTSNLVFHRSLIKKIGGFSDLLYVNDLDFILRAIQSQPCSFVPQELMAYRIHDQNTIRQREKHQPAFLTELSLALAGLFVGKKGNTDPKLLAQILARHHAPCLPAIAFILQSVKVSGKRIKSLAADRQFKAEIQGIVEQAIARDNYLQELQEGQQWLSRENEEQKLFIRQLKEDAQRLQTRIKDLQSSLQEAQNEHQTLQQQLKEGQQEKQTLQKNLQETREKQQALQDRLQDVETELVSWQKKAEEIWEARTFYREQYELTLGSREFQLGQAISQLVHGQNISHNCRQVLKLCLPSRAVACLQQARDKQQIKKLLQGLQKRQKRLQAMLRPPRIHTQQPYAGPLISVITPCYNHGRYLGKWLASLQAQTWQDFEIILVNDGSTDQKTIAKLKELEAANIPGLKILHQENRGVVAARNRAIDVSQGKYIFPLDADDSIEQTFLEKCVYFLENSPDHYFVYTWTLSHGETTFVWETRDSRPLELLGENRIGFAVFPRQALERCGGYSSTMQEGYEDWELAVRLVKLGYVGKVIPEPLYHYLVQPGSRNDQANQQRSRLVRLIADQHAAELHSQSRELKKRQNQLWKVRNGLVNLLRSPMSREEFLFLDLSHGDRSRGDRSQDALPQAQVLGFALRNPDRRIILLAPSAWKDFFLLNPRDNLQVYFPQHYQAGAGQGQFLDYLHQRYRPRKIHVQDLQTGQTETKRTAILYLAPWLITGGADQMTVDWFNLLPDEEFAKYLVLTEPSSNEWLLKVRGKARGIYDLPALGITGPGQISQFCTRLIELEGIDILHIMNSARGYALLPDLKRHFPALKAVAQLHCFDYLPDGQPAGYPRDVPRHYDSHVDCYNVVSRALQEEMLQLYPHLDSKKFKVVYCGINSRLFAPSKDTARQDRGQDTKFQILFIGRLDVQKQPLRMAEIGFKLKQKIQDLDFVIHVLGGGSLDSQEKDLRNYIRQNGLADNIILHGPRPREEMPDWYSRAHCLLLTSKWEGIPVVLYEAMSMGLPCIAPDVGGVRELLGHECGILLPAQAGTDDYVQAVLKLARDHKLAANLGRKARERICRQFDLEQTRQGYLELYRELIQPVPASTN